MKIRFKKSNNPELNINLHSKIKKNTNNRQLMINRSWNYQLGQISGAIRLTWLDQRLLNSNITSLFGKATL